MSSLEDKIKKEAVEKLRKDFNKSINIQFDQYTSITKKELIKLFQEQFKRKHSIKIWELLKFIRGIYISKKINKQFERDLDSFYNNIKSKLNEK